MSSLNFIRFHSEQRKILCGEQRTVSPSCAEFLVDCIKKGKYQAHEEAIILKALENSGFSVTKNGSLELEVPTPRRASPHPKGIIAVNTETVPGYEIIEVISMVSGNIAYSKHAMEDFFAGLKATVGGEVFEYTDLLEEARVEATNRMLLQAKDMGASAVLNVRYGTSTISNGISEILVYGTAVKLKT
ncbi:YbjQ family protein [Vibrio mimicus]|uniref:YbjQ family protein n=1 Tax=Vibrio mimicus TaxID=674 RepID=UPI00292A3E86|nr:YbjQ family protein [Vibrio mimicus]